MRGKWYVGVDKTGSLKSASWVGKVACTGERIYALSLIYNFTQKPTKE